MKIVEPKIIIPKSELDRFKVKSIERYGRICYKSEDKITDDSATVFIEKILANGHHSVIEHEKISLIVICDRGVSHEIVRHRIGSYSQESTRYCNYSKDKFNNEITVIMPFFFKDHMTFSIWQDACLAAEQAYFMLLDRGVLPQEARSVLPNSLKTEIVITYNLREWRHFFDKRCHRTAHPQMRQISLPILKSFIDLLPELFGDLAYMLGQEYNFFPKKHLAEVEYVDSMF